MTAKLPDDESRRLAVLRSLVLLDTPPDERFDAVGMKGINDRFGHSEGDRALVDAARLLEGTFRHRTSRPSWQPPIWPCTG